MPQVCILLQTSMGLSVVTLTLSITCWVVLLSEPHTSPVTRTIRYKTPLMIDNFQDNAHLIDLGLHYWPNAWGQQKRVQLNWTYSEMHYCINTGSLFLWLVQFQISGFLNFYSNNHERNPSLQIPVFFSMKNKWFLSTKICILEESCDERWVMAA